MPNNRRKLTTWPQALAFALDLIDGIPGHHTVTEVRFGTFADRVEEYGGTHYVSINVRHELGNTHA